MAMKLYSDSDISDIADAIRSKNGTSNTYKVSQMASAIQAIPTGITPTGTKQISITQNGTTTEDVTNYASAEITVNVSGGGGISIDDIATNTQPSGVVTLGNSVTSIGSDAFRSKTGITSVIGLNVITIGTSAFYSCSGMTEVFFPSCTTLKTEVFRESGILTLTDSHLPLVTSMVQASLGNMRNVTTVSLSSPTSLPNYCLDACSSLESVSFPNVTSIGLGCFRNCTMLTRLILRHTSVVQLKNISAFATTPMRGYNSQNGTVYVPSALISSYQTATNWSTIYSEGHCTFVAIEGSIYE